MQRLIRDVPFQPSVCLRLPKILTVADISKITKDNAIIRGLADCFYRYFFDDVCGKNKMKVKWSHNMHEKVLGLESGEK